MQIKAGLNSGGRYAASRALKIRSARLSVVFLVVDAEDASFGNPPFALCGHEFLYPLAPDKLEVVNLAHAIPRPVPVIQVPQSLAGKLEAVAAELAGAFVANAQPAVDAGLGLVLLGIVAAAARIVLAQVRFADSAIHPARRNQVLGNPVRHFIPNSGEVVRALAADIPVPEAGAIPPTI